MQHLQYEYALESGRARAVRIAYPPGHIRTPFYICGKIGVIESICGEFANPEELAYGRDGLPKKFLYWVRFQLIDVWSNYTGSMLTNLT